MQVYIEYAFAENFLLDAMLLYLAHRFVRRESSTIGIVCAAAFGASFACIAALCVFSYRISFLLKISAGALMCFLSRLPCKGGAVKNVKAYFSFSRLQKLTRIVAYMKYTGVFFALSACLAGILYAIDYTGAALKAWQIPVCVFFLIACKKTGEKLFKAQRTSRFIRNCELCKTGEKSGVRVCGLIDSGNRAAFTDGTPICFISPETALSLMDTQTKMLDFSIGTVGGTRKIKIFSGVILIYGESCEHTINKRWVNVYFSPSAHLSFGENAGYSALLPAMIFCESEDWRKECAYAEEAASKKNALNFCKDETEKKEEKKDKKAVERTAERKAAKYKRGERR